MNRNYLLIFYTLIFCFSFSKTLAQIPNNFELGAQVFIEPGQTLKETEQWFKILKENGMNVCRIRMFESYMHKADGSWDFSLFDRAFSLAEKYDIKVYATFFPATDKEDIGGWKFPKNQTQLQEFSQYIEKLVVHFGQYKSLYAWVLINEPGGGLNNTEFSNKMRSDWDKNNPSMEYLPNGYRVLVDIQEYRFKRSMTSWMLNWIASEVRKNDSKVGLHVNNHAIFSNAQEYDFPYWRTFLTSLGGSAHASWHFGQFKRHEYALAMSANSEMLLSGSGKLPWMMTELQGGNNTFSAHNPMCPTKEEVSQWLWTVIGSEGLGGIFWSLNARASGIESGEWALVDFQNKATERVTAIKNVSDCLKENKAVFQDIEKAETGINLLYIRESIWTENIITKGLPAEKDGRKTEMNDLLGYFQAFSEMGISPNIKAFEEFDFTKNDYTGATIILANQLAVPNNYKSLLETFVEKGGKLIVGGLTAFYDENVHNTMLTGFPFRELFGGEISEFRFLETPKEFTINNHQVYGEKWESFLKPNKNAEIVSSAGDKIYAIHSKHKKGSVVWIPTLLGVYGRNHSCKQLSELLLSICDATVDFRFSNHHANVLMKTLKSGNGYVTILINKNKEKQIIDIQKKDVKLQSKILFNDGGGTIINGKININHEETLVIHWK